MAVRKFVLVLCCLILSTSIVACAESNVVVENAVDLTKFSLNELTDLKEQIVSEFATRGIEEYKILPVGAYIAGKNIAPGNYVLHVYNEGGSVLITALKEGIDSGTLFRDYDFTGKLSCYPVVFQQSGEYSVSLEKGQTLCVIPNEDSGFSGIVTIEKSSGLFMN